MPAAATKRVSRGKRAAAAALIRSGVPVRQAAAELGIGRSTAHRAATDPTIDEEDIERIKDRVQGKMIKASDRFLDQSLGRIQDLHPYQAMLCAGIAHDHYLRSRAASQSTGVGSITNILVMIDQRTRSSGDGQ